MKQPFCRFIYLANSFSHFHAAGTRGLKVTRLTNSYYLLGIHHVTGAGPRACFNAHDQPVRWMVCVPQMHRWRIRKAKLLA